MVTDKSGQEEPHIQDLLLMEAENLGKQFRRTARIKQPEETGLQREKEIRNVLEKYLPKRCSLGKGIVESADGERSLGQDVVIYDAMVCPLLFGGEDQGVYPIESVYAAIEVKSYLDSPTLKDSVKKIESVKRLRKRRGRGAPMPGMTYKGMTTPMLFGAVFAYKGKTDIATLAAQLSKVNKELPWDHVIDMIWILQPAGLIGWHSESETVTWSQGGTRRQSDRIVAFRTQYAPLIFFNTLIEHVKLTAPSAPSLFDYIGEGLVLQIAWMETAS